MSRYKCPACGATLRPDGGSGEAVCEYCGYRVAEPPRTGYRGKMKYCRHCGAHIPEKAVICTKCGCQVEELRREDDEPQVVVNHHYHTARPEAAPARNISRQRSKWTAFALCVFLGWIGAHKFYEGKHFWGVVYVLTFAFGGIGWLVDCMVLLFKPNPYYV